MRELAEARRRANRDRIRHIAASAESDLDALARLFEDDGIADDGTVAGRVRSLLSATERPLIPGLYTVVPFGDSGFSGDQTPGGAGFRDPWPSSRNQVGHFLTALGLQLHPEVVSRPVPVLRSIRTMVGAPVAMDDAEVALRLAIGHEKRRDPRTAVPAATRVAVAGATAYALSLRLGRAGATRGLLVAGVVAATTVQQIAAILAMFRAQFSATTDADLAAWQSALAASGSGAFDRTAVDGDQNSLQAIATGRHEGNSVQDLRLSLVGWHLGQLIADDTLHDRHTVGAWIRRALGDDPEPAGQCSAQRPARVQSEGGKRQSVGVDPGLLVHLVVDSRLVKGLVALATRVLPAPRVQLMTYDVALPRLPRQLDGLRVLHVSDLHLHPPGSDLAWQLPALLAGVPYDLLCYTGDFIDTDDDIPLIEQLLSRMPSHAAYAVLGNHDHIPFGRARSSGSNDSARLREALARCGIKVLTNDARPLCDGALFLVGIDDPATHRDDLGRAYARVPEGACTMLLAHSPDIVLRLGHFHPDLILSGHTHGGQIRVPLVGALVTMSQLPRGLVAGLTHLDASSLFVTRGIGYSGLNMRVGSPAEVALLTLRSRSR